MNKYKNLLKNTAIFGLGTFSSKIMQFALVWFATHALSTDQLGTASIIVQTANLLIPLISLGIADTVLRFGLDNSQNKTDIFTVGLSTIFLGFLIFAPFSPLLWLIPDISAHAYLIIIFVLTSSLRSLCSQFTRSLQKMKLFALDGVVTSLSTLVFTITFLFPLKMGINGYVLAIIFADTLSVVFLTVFAQLYKYIKFTKKPAVRRPMLAYAIPLIPTTIFWWITNVSDRYMVTYMLGASANGLYDTSYRIPTIITLIFGVFMQAFQVSAVTDDEQARGNFFSRVFSAMSSLIFIVAAALIPLSKLAMKILVAESYYGAWKYVPLLVMAMTFACFVQFFGTVYMVRKKSVNSMTTTLFGGIINIGLNFLLIPQVGVNGAAFATFTSYLIVFLIRAWDTRRLLSFKWNTWKTLTSTIILATQTTIMLLELPNWIPIECALALLLLSLHWRSIASVRSLLPHHRSQ